MNGSKWREALQKKSIENLSKLNNALHVLSEDEDVRREFGNLGLWDGFPSLRYLILSVISEKKEAERKAKEYIDESEKDY